MILYLIISETEVNNFILSYIFISYFYPSRVSACWMEIIFMRLFVIQRVCDTALKCMLQDIAQKHSGNCNERTILLIKCTNKTTALYLKYNCKC